MRVQLRRAALLLVALAGVPGVVTACVGEPPLAEPPVVDRASFETDVYPVLLRDCAFPACHGNPSRFFRVFGPGRTRLDPTTGLYSAPTTAEIDASFDRARSMLSGVPDPRQALLLRKPLEPSEGGAAHMGVDALGRNVYSTRDDPGWRAIAAWAGALAGTDAGTAETDAGSSDASASDGAIADGAAEDAP